MTTDGSQRHLKWFLLSLVLLYATLAASYYVLRYAGQWTESDTAVLTLAITSVARDGTLVPAQHQYSLGFAYQAVSTFVIAATGLTVQQLQLLVYPIVASGLSLIAFAMYRALTEDTMAGALAAQLLFLQPDFLFVIFRGSHEKITWLAAMLAVLLLAKSFRVRQKFSAFVALVLLFYTAAAAVIASNAFFGSSFIAAITVSLLAYSGQLWLARHRQASRVAQATTHRLTLIVASTMVVWFLIVFYVYPPATRILRDLQGTANRTAAVTTGLEPAYDPYAAVSRGWISQTAYLGLTLPTWVMAATSFAVWIHLGVGFMRHRRSLDNPPQLLPWLLYAGFGVQLAISLILSYGGGMSANLQLRVFPAVMLFGIGLVGLGLVRVWRAGRVSVSLFAAALLILALWAGAASLLKMTNDPSLSQNWTFWSVSEDRAVRWVERHLRGRSVWLGLEGVRLSAYAVGTGFGEDSRNSYDAGTVNLETRHLIVSSVDLDMSQQKRVPVPDIRGESRVYDNGDSKLYHKRPRTPYQR
ncbi:MAG: hypothetical protein FJ026_04350 [Chloroflexi bacterium]|nr:hypothetical protein [Chloroflexota bacterium]